MGRKKRAANARSAELRQTWASNVGPFMVAAREGALQANRTARAEWARTHWANRRWYRRRWFAVLAGLALGAAAGGAAATLLRRREEDLDLETVREQAHTGPGQPHTGAQPPMDQSREAVSAARERDHFRNDGPLGPTY